MSEAIRTAGLAAIFLVIFIPLVLDWAKNRPEETDEREESEYPTGDAERDKIILKRFEITKNRTDQKYRSYEIIYWCGISLLTLFAAGGAWIGVVLAAQALEASRQQAAAAQEQLTAMRDEQRPWVKLSISPGDLEWFTNRKFGWTGSMSPSLVATNVGHSPALRVRARALSYFPRQQGSLKDAQSKLCSSLDDKSIGRDSGTILFPSDHFDASEVGTGKTGFAILQDDLTSLVRDKDGQQTFSLEVIGCADYSYGLPVEHHQTMFAYEVWNRTRVNGSRPGQIGFFKVGENVQAEDIQMFQTYGYNYGN